MTNNDSDFEPVLCPVLNKKIDPCLCYETRFGISNILKNAGVSDADAMKICRENCIKIRGFVEKTSEPLREAM